jgi:hypothetical protein
MTLSAEVFLEFTTKFEGAANKTNRAAFVNDAALVFLNALMIIVSMADRAKMVFWFNQVMTYELLSKLKFPACVIPSSDLTFVASQVIVHLLTIEPDEEPVLTVFTTRVLIQSIHECMQMLDEDAPIEDRKEFATEVHKIYFSVLAITSLLKISYFSLRICTNSFARRYEAKHVKISSKFARICTSTQFNRLQSPVPLKSGGLKSV